MSTMNSAPPQADVTSNRSRTATRLLASAIAFGTVAAIVFYALPGLDISVSSLFYLGNSQFAGMTPLLDVVRDILAASFVGLCLVAIAGVVIAASRNSSWLSISSAGWLYLVVCLGVGPGLIGNIALKNNWGRARPTQITEFGGSKVYTLPLTPSHQCSRNCSFVAGEASTVFIVFFAAAFLFPRRARTLFAGSVILGSLAGLMRMSQGAHFFSDVVFAGVTMAATAALLDIAFDAFQRRQTNKAGARAYKT